MMKKKKGLLEESKALLDDPKQKSSAEIKQEYMNECALMGDVIYQLETSLPQRRTEIQHKLRSLQYEYKTAFDKEQADAQKPL